MRDHESTDLAGAAHFARGEGFDDRERPTLADEAEGGKERWVVAVSFAPSAYAVMTLAEFDEGVWWDRLHDALEAAGFVCDVGGARVMRDAEVVPASPLDQKLRAARA